MGNKLFSWIKKKGVRRVIDELDKRNIHIDGDEKNLTGGAPKQPQFIEYEGGTQTEEKPAPEEL
ncbi:hypothetical protein [Spirosoma sp.]|uniref:hypothetical protein n=1 Tax=Spirosoma sp. TaxID=1899569 RepID=UPI0026109C6E|nr:hypothetical protein [Spirosoma sp.]MCX6212975.1 hypothetical protein [Spirosoma sp.]